MSLGPVDTNALNVRGGDALLASVDAIVTLEEPGGICFFSSTARQMFGWQEHEVWGKPFDFLVREEAATPRRERGLHEPEACCHRIGHTAMAARSLPVFIFRVALRARAYELSSFGICRAEMLWSESGAQLIQKARHWTAPPLPLS